MTSPAPQDLRTRVRARITAEHLTLRAAAQQIGVAQATLHRFLGKPASAETTTKLTRWLDQEGDE